MNPFVRYLTTLSTTATLSLSLLGAINWRVDPFLIFENNRLGVYSWVERQFKSSAIKTYQHDAVLLGTSKTALINPDDLPMFKFFNASFSSAAPEDILLFLKQNLTQEKFVLIGLDLFTFNEKAYPYNDSNELYRDDLLENLFSLNASKESLRTLGLHFLGRPPLIQENGQRHPSPDNDEDSKGGEVFDARVDRIAHKYYSSFTFSEKRIVALQDIRDLLEKRGVGHKVFLNPINEKEYEALLSYPQAHTSLLTLKKELSRIFPGYVDLTLSRYSKLSYYYKDDPVHYKPHVGKWIVDEVMKNSL